jgi:D-sedoheptulose 7-phosphate isomerase
MSIATSASNFADLHISESKDTISLLDRGQIVSFIEVLYEAYRSNRTIFVVGNGGSATTAQHMVCDLGKTVLGPSGCDNVRRFRVVCLNDNTAMLTAWSNDVSYEVSFSQYLRNLARRHDLLVVISASGNSPNILAAVRMAATLGMRSVGLLGFHGGAVRSLLDHAVVVESDHYGHIEDAHLMLVHLATAFFKRLCDQATDSRIRAE